MNSRNHWLRPCQPCPFPRIWAQTRALLVSQDRRHLFVTPPDLNVCPYTGNIFTVKIILHLYVKIFLHDGDSFLSLSHEQFSLFILLNWIFHIFPFQKKFHSVCFAVNCFQTVYQSPQRPLWPPLSRPLCPWLAPRLPPRVPSRTGPPPLWLGFWRPDPSPRWDGGSWPESQSGGGGGMGLGGEVGGCAIAAAFFLTGAGAGTKDSSLALLLAGSPSSPPLTRSAISFLAATLLALEVRWTPSPAQMLVPSTVVRF